MVDLYPKLITLLAEVEASIQRVWQEDACFLSAAAREVLSRRGKRLRPSILLLAAECAGGATKSSIVLSSVVEIVHTASLVHDDIVDNSHYRRGCNSAKAVWGDAISVLLGDYLIARSFELLSEEERARYLPGLVRAAARMCEGQAKELRAVGRVLTEKKYLEIARDKTAALFEFCGRVGVETAGGSPEMAAALGQFGEHFGFAFQAADDILDLMGSNGKSGKPEGHDLAEGKLTLPLILAAEDSNASAKLKHLLRTGELTDDDLQTARAIAEAAGGIERAWERVQVWLDAARESLTPLPDGSAKQALLATSGYRFPMPVMS